MMLYNYTWIRIYSYSVYSSTICTFSFLHTLLPTLAIGAETAEAGGIAIAWLIPPILVLLCIAALIAACARYWCCKWVCLPITGLLVVFVDVRRFILSLSASILLGSSPPAYYLAGIVYCTILNYLHTFVL